MTKIGKGGWFAKVAAQLRNTRVFGICDAPDEDTYMAVFTAMESIPNLRHEQWCHDAGDSLFDGFFSADDRIVAYGAWDTAVARGVWRFMDVVGADPVILMGAASAAMPAVNRKYIIVFPLES